MSHKHHNNESKPTKPEQAVDEGKKSDQDSNVAGEIAQLSREELEQKLNEAEAKANQSWDQVLRVQAEVENIRRRTEREISNAHKYGLEKIIMELLPIIDGIEHGLAIPVPNEAAKAVHEGMEMTLNMMIKMLEKFGVKQINPKGENFNPEQHQAIQTKSDPNAQANSVIEVLQKGYALQDRLLRPALVIVAQH